MSRLHEHRCWSVDEDLSFADQLRVTTFDVQPGTLCPFDLTGVVVVRDPLVTSCQKRSPFNGGALQTVHVLTRGAKFDGA